MRQFIYGNDSAYLALQDSTRSNCVVFHYPKLPITCQPPMATRIGFEMAGNEAVVLMLDPVATIHYNGQSLRMRQLLEQGELRFDNFAALADFMRGELRTEFEAEQEVAVRGNPLRVESAPTE
jgi:hypothetical protein